ncbi:hypothetical protein ACS0TY_010639 [Phlomoides rotata]
MNDSSSPSEEEACAFAMQLVTASVLPAALKTAIELDLLELIKKAGSVSPAELAAQIHTTNPEAPVMLDRILRLLAANNILDCKLRTLPAADAGVERLYSLSPLSKFLTRNNHGYSLAPLLLISQDKILMQIWQHLKEAVVEGGVPFDRAYGMNAFQYPATDPRLNKIFNQGVEHIAGDMFVSVPRGDAIFMKWVCHDWEDEECLKLLKNCHDALPDYGRVIIADRLLPEIPEKTLLASTDYAVDVMMLAYGPSGKERTESQFRALAKASGFNQFRKLCSCFNIWIMELYK